MLFGPVRRLPFVSCRILDHRAKPAELLRLLALVLVLFLVVLLPVLRSWLQ